MSANQPHSRTIVSVGNFDGAHLGHQALVREARKMAGNDGRVVLLVFDPHPTTVLHSVESAPLRLTDFSVREKILLAAGADAVVRLEPTPELLNLKAPEFVNWLRTDFKMNGIVEGPDFRFGKNRAGNLKLLKTLGEEWGFTLRILTPVEITLDDQTRVRASSTMVRWLLRHGRVADVARILGRDYGVTGTVVAGVGRGRTIGIPTANVETSGMLPARGVYAGRARGCGTGNPGGRNPWHAAAINLGTRPTFDTGTAETCEVHLLRFDRAIGEYGWEIEVEFKKYLRDEMKFDSAAAVVVQIQRDIAKVAADRSSGLSEIDR